MASDPRIEAVYRELAEPTEILLINQIWREEAARLVAAADAVDPLRDRDRMVEIIVRAHEEFLARDDGYGNEEWRINQARAVADALIREASGGE